MDLPYILENMYYLFAGGIEVHSCHRRGGAIGMHGLVTNAWIGNQRKIMFVSNCPKIETSQFIVHTGYHVRIVKQELLKSKGLIDVVHLVITL